MTLNVKHQLNSIICSLAKIISKKQKEINKNINHNLENENNMDNFKGIYYNDNNEQNYFENGAHFKYREMCGKLEKL